jgi:E3 ubiquitin-protein ligase synoviolin
MQVTCLSIISKYILNSYAHYRAQEHWEGKSTYQFYIDLATDFLKLLTYIGFLSLTLTFHGLPINVLRDVYYTFRSFITKCNNLVRFRQATRNMNERYPNATRAEMESLTDKTCIICREDMEFRDDHEPQAGDPAPNNNNGTPPAGPNDTPKKLVCGHIFHFHCLRSWLERQQTCPTWLVPLLFARTSSALLN